MNNMVTEPLGVIIPVHNVEAYLSECIESIIHQTYSNLEIILIDDGSQDNSYLICQKYATLDKRIKCHHFEHSEGAIRARRKGTELTSAQYVTYVDSDDWLEVDAFEKLMVPMVENETDVAIPLGRFHEFTSENRQTITKDILEPGVYKGRAVDEIRDKMIAVDVWPMLANRIYRKDIIYPYLVKANPQILINNDITCVMMMMMHVESVVAVDGIVYHYRKNENSITNTYKSGYLKSNCLMYQCVKEEIIKTHREYLLQEWKVHFLQKLFMNIRIECSMGNKISTSEKMQHLRELYTEKIFEDFLKDDNCFDLKGRDAMIWKLVQKKCTWTLFLYLKMNALKCRLLEVKTRA